VPRRGNRLTLCLLLSLAAALAPFLGAQSHDSPDSFDSLLKRGFALHQQSAYAQALPLLQRAQRLKPQDYFVNLLVGIDLLRTGQPALAVPRLKLAASARSVEEIPVEYLGEAQARLGDYSAAAEAYQVALERSHASEDAEEAWAGYSLERFRQIGSELRASRQGTAVAYRLQAEALASGSSEQLALFAQAAEADPMAAGIWSERGLAQFAAPDSDPSARVAAGASLLRALQRDSDDLEAWRLQALLAADSAQWQQAQWQLFKIGEHSPAVLRRALESWPPSLLPPAADEAAARSPLWQCIRTRNFRPCLTPSRAPLASSGNPTRYFAEQRWERIAALPAPGVLQASAWFQRGVAFVALNDCTHAIPALERGLATNRVEAEYRLSVCYANEAGSAAQRLQSIATDQSAVHRLRADVLLRLKGDPAAALTEYRAALLSRPGDPALLERIAEAQWSSGDADAARQSAQAALAIDPHRIEAMRTLARISMSNRAYAEALPYLREVSAEEPGDRGVAVELGTACAQTSHPDEELRWLQPALAAGYPDEKGSLHALLGQILRTLGRNGDAALAFAQSRKLSDAYQDSAQRSQHAQQ
jgi:predicted Zn-dependent protease